MVKGKYPISREFFPYSLFTPPISRPFVLLAQKAMKIPRFIYKDPGIETGLHRIPAFQGGEIELYVFKPRKLQSPAPCLLLIHGGGFVFEGSGSHFRYALSYAKEVRCVVVYVRYRLAPAFPFPFPQEDSYAALCWVDRHANELGIDRARIGIGGDSAGGTLAVTACMMARDRQSGIKPLFQLLIYPWLDDRNVSESYLKYTDTPMWNSFLSRRVGLMTNPDPSATPLVYRSPVKADSFEGLPPAYIEVAEFDPLHDDGINYAALLRGSAIPVELHETEGTMHGFDTKINAPTSRRMLAARVNYMRNRFCEQGEKESERDEMN